MNQKRVAELTAEMNALAKRQVELANELHREIANDAEPTPLRPKPSAQFMKLGDYATYRAISIRTLHEYISRGLPSDGEGKARRILVDAANAWIAAHGGKRAANG